MAFFLWKKVAPDDSRLFVEKQRPCRGLAWLIFHHKISRFIIPIKNLRPLIRGRGFSI